MKGQTHLVPSEFRLIDNTPQTAWCRLPIAQAAQQFCWDDLEVGKEMPESTLLFCGKCLMASMASHAKRPLYVYGVIDKVPEKEPMEST